MGQVISVFMGWFGSDREYKVLLIGLDNAGKTTTLYQMHLGQAIETQPTIGSNVETVRHKNVHFEVSFFFFDFNLRVPLACLESNAYFIIWWISILKRLCIYLYIYILFCF